MNSIYFPSRSSGLIAMEQLEKEHEAYALQIAGRLIKAREHVGMTQHELADKVDTTQNLIYRLEKGLAVSREMFTFIALYFIRQHGINFEWLFNPDPEEEANIPMLTSKRGKRKRVSEKQEDERLNLLNQFLEDIKKVKGK